MSDETAIQQKPNNDLASVYQPKNLEQAQWLAQKVVQSGLAPSGVRKPEDALVILMTGAELGLRPMEALRGIYVVNGRPTLKADLMVALVRQSPKCKYFTRREMSGQQCTYETKRSDQPQSQSYTYTIEQARNAGLTDKGVWQDYPDRMLRARAASALAREEYPEVLLGLYTPEEAASISDNPNTDPVVAEVVEGETGSAGPEPTDQRPATHTDDTKREKITDRIKERLEEAALDPERVCEPLAAWACGEYDVEHWRWLDVEQLIEIGQTISSCSANGGRLSARRLAVIRRIEPYLDGTLDDAVDWGATGGESDDWDTANRRWRVLVDEAADSEGAKERYHEALKSLHEAASFNDLTVAQIVDDIHQLEQLSPDPGEDDGMAPRLDYMLAEIEKHLPAPSAGVGEGPGGEASSAEAADLSGLSTPHSDLVDLIDDVASDVRDQFIDVILKKSTEDTYEALPNPAVQTWIDMLRRRERGEPAPQSDATGSERRAWILDQVHSARSGADQTGLPKGDPEEVFQ